MFKKVFWIIISIICTGFIFYNSSQVGNVSHDRSTRIVNKIIDILKGEEISINTLKISKNITNNINGNDSMKGINNVNYSVKKVTNTEFKENESGIKNKLLNKIRNLSLIKNITRSELDHIIRKIAHMFEFALLALSLCFLFDSFGVNKYNTIIYALFLLLFIAVTDETIQRNVVGRESSTVDVLIDFIGGSISAVMFIIYKFK